MVKVALVTDLGLYTVPESVAWQVTLQQWAAQQVGGGYAGESVEARAGSPH